MKNLNKEPVLITGAAGFIGSNLLRRLVTKYSNINIIIKSNSDTWRINDLSNSINVYNCDLSDYSLVKKIIDEIKPKIIFHLAAYGAYHYQNNLDLIRKINLDSTINLLNACLKYDFRIFINTGSNSEYGFKRSPMKESDVLEPNSYYSVFKSASTHFCMYESKSKKRPIVTLRPFHVYGPFEERTRFIPALIDHLKQGKCPPLVSPEIKRDMIFIDDVVDFYLTVVNELNGYGNIYNVGSGIERSIKDIVEIAIKITGADVTPVFGTMQNRDWDNINWKADMSFTRKNFNWTPKIDLNTGLKRTITWQNSFNQLS
jgi:nucleoside-diphosphate-sugar epimerase